MNRKAKIFYGVECCKGRYEMVGFKARVVRLEVSVISSIVKGEV